MKRSEKGTSTLFTESYISFRCTHPFSFWWPRSIRGIARHSFHVELCIPLNRRINARARNAKNRGGRGDGNVEI